MDGAKRRDILSASYCMDTPMPSISKKYVEHFTIMLDIFEHVYIFCFKYLGHC